jgi:hypothetical protein
VTERISNEGATTITFMKYSTLHACTCYTPANNNEIEELNISKEHDFLAQPKLN